MNIYRKNKELFLIPAVILFLWGVGLAGESARSAHAQNRAVVSAEEEKVQSVSAERIQMEEPETEEDTTAEAEAPFVPTPGELNLAHYFPEDADTSDIVQSYAGQIFSLLMSKDEDWFNRLYDYADSKPEDVVLQLGKSRNDIMGKYNPKDDRHIEEDPSTWTINSFKRIRMTTTDGDGHVITPYSNVIAIMSMANLYTFFFQAEDPELFLSYSKKLWDNSHSYTVTLSEVYFCEGCMDEEDELKQLEAELLAEDGETEASSEDSSEASPQLSAAVPAAVITSASEETILEETTWEETMGEETAIGKMSPVIDVGIKTDAASDSAEDSESSVEERTDISTASDANANQKSLTAPVSQYKCPGHVDLIVNAKIIGLDEENNLFSRDTVGNSPKNISENGWKGWNQYTKASAKLLSTQDWFEKYGLSLSSISPGNPLTPAEIEEYMAALSENLSNERKSIIRFALESVGKIPYYWGGKPSAPNYENNQFGTLTTPDYKGRVFKGLDCSGWINWVYWSVTGQRLAYESTTGLAVLGTRINRSQLQPGDIIIKTGTEAHVIMFLGWTDDGKIQCIHESSAGVNNVTVAVREANWPYYRKLIRD